MNIIKRIKIILQRNKGYIIIPHIKQDKADKLSIFEITNQSNQSKTPKNPSNGYWVILQNWSQCTLKCGGGRSYLHRICFPPKNGGKDCIGDAIISKPCNINPCPNIIRPDILFRNNTETLKPIMKTMPISSRPLRYSKCVIKESDLIYTKNYQEEKENKKLISNYGVEDFDEMQNLKIPVRIIMNNRTITIFTGEDYNTNVETFLLKKSKFERDIKKQECFFIKEEIGNKKAHLCILTEGKKEIEEWDYDFNLFKHQCNYQKSEHIMEEFQKKFDEKIKDIKKDLMEESQLKKREKDRLNEETNIQTYIKNTKTVAINAIKKEINLEELIRQEELERERREEQLMLKKIEDERKKRVKNFYFNNI